MNNGKILIISDSLTLPRNKPEIVTPEETWPSILQERINKQVIIIAIGGATIKDLYRQTKYYSAFNPEIIIIQSGIVDCVPRALGQIENEIININKYISAISNRILPINFLRRVRNKTYTSKKDFKKYASNILNLFPNSKIIWVGILPAKIEYEYKIRGVSNNISKYNDIIKELLEKRNYFFLSTDEIPTTGIMSDYHHLSKIGHEWITNRVLSLI